MKFPILLDDLGTKYPTEKSKEKKRYGLYRCMCGADFVSECAKIKSGNTKSCGCYKKQLIIEKNTTHGMTKHPIYGAWFNIKQRTTNHRNKNFKDYGGRGIVMCDEWLNSFEKFMDDMMPTWKKGLSIDRINNDGNYEPSNCRWTVQTIQSRNSQLIRLNNKSGFRGVSVGKNGKWVASIGLNGKSKHLGSFNSPMVAAEIYNSYVIENKLEHTLNIMEIPRLQFNEAKSMVDNITLIDLV